MNERSMFYYIITDLFLNLLMIGYVMNLQRVEQDMSLKHLKVYYNGMWLQSDHEVVTWGGTNCFYIHNVNPAKPVLARIYQLVMKEQKNETDRKPVRAWYIDQKILKKPYCIKPLHTVQHMRDMLKNMEDVRSDWGTVYFQNRERIMLTSDHCLYSLPKPLSNVPAFERMENLYHHALFIQETEDVLSPDQLRLLHERRSVPFASRHA